MNVPWPKVRIDEVGHVQAGRQRSPSIVAGLMRPYLRVANVHDGYIDYHDVLEMPFSDAEFETFSLMQGDILLNEGQSLKLVGRSAVYEGSARKYCFQNSLIRFRASDKIDVTFAHLMFQHLLSSGVFASIATRTTSIAHLGLVRFAGLPIPLPDMGEQRVISEVLSTWGRGIRQLSDLIAAKVRFKQGLMQQLLTGRRRYAGFAHSPETHQTPCGVLPIDWKTAPLSQFARELRRKNSEGVIRVLTASGTHGLVDQREYFNRRVAGKAIDKYYLLKRGDFAYNRSLMKGYPFGATKRLDNYESGVVSTLYLCFQLVSEECLSDYLVLLFEGGMANSQLRGIAKMGARAHGLLNVDASDFFRIEIPVPKAAEQRCIVKVIREVDSELAYLQREITALKLQKKALMQKLLTGQVRLKSPSCSGL